MSVRDWQLFYDDIKREVQQYRRNGVPVCAVNVYKRTYYCIKNAYNPLDIQIGGGQTYK